MSLLLSFAAGFLLQAEGIAVKGTVSVMSSPMPVVDGVAVWDPATGEMRIALVPFKLQEKQLESIRKDETQLVLFDVPSPNPKKWSDWSPGAEMKVTFKGKDASKGPAGVESISVWISGVKEKGFMNTFLNETETAVKEFSKLDFKPDGKGGGTLTAVFTRKKSDAAEVSWDVSLKCPVLAPLEKK